MAGLPCSVQKQICEISSHVQLCHLHLRSNLLATVRICSQPHICGPKIANTTELSSPTSRAPCSVTAGIQNTTTKLNIILGITCSSFAIALIGAACVDRLGRRPLLLFTNFGCACVWIGITGATGSFAANGGSSGDSILSPDAAKPSGSAALAMIYIFSFVYSFGFTPLQALYPVQVLSFVRAKGMAFSNFVVSTGEYSYPVSHIIC